MGDVKLSVPEIVIIGGGGHATVLIDSLRAAGEKRVMAVLDADASGHGTSICGVPVIGGDDLLETLARSGTHSFFVGVGGTSDNRPRARLYEKAKRLGLAPVTIRHPSAIVSPDATIGEGCQILPGAIVNARAVLGENVIVNSGAVVEHDCVIGDHTHIATGALLASTVRIGKFAHISIGAVVRQVIKIGNGAVVGAGAVVIKDVEENTIVVGVPAKEKNS